VQLVLPSGVVKLLVALAIVLAGGVLYLGFRVHTLEQRLAAVNAQLGTPAPSSASGVARASAPAASAKVAARSGLEPRVTGLEQKLASLQADVRSLETATESTLNQPPADPKQILSVVTSEASRIRDSQLDFHKQQWVKWRRGTLAQFATTYALSDQQRAQLDRLLLIELDGWVDLLRREDLYDKPEQLAREARSAMRETDESVQDVLDAKQYEHWMQMRTLERHTHFAFLPE
jgi:hypothetical protein